MTEALTESAAWGVGVGLVWWWTEFKPSLQTTFIVVHVGDPLGSWGNRHEMTWGPAVGPWPALSCLFDAVIPLHLCVSPICTAYYVHTHSPSAAMWSLVSEPRAGCTLITEWPRLAAWLATNAMRCDVM